MLRKLVKEREVEDMKGVRPKGDETRRESRDEMRTTEMNERPARHHNDQFSNYWSFSESALVKAEEEKTRRRDEKKRRDGD